jgi:hypothetical protein
MHTPRSVAETNPAEDGFESDDEYTIKAPHSTTRHSVYPVGVMTSRQAHQVPRAHALISAIRGYMGSHTRESASKIVLGAYCAMQRDDCFGCPKPRTYFLEDVECPDMHAYALRVEAVLCAHTGGGEKKTDGEKGKRSNAMSPTRSTMARDDVKIARMEKEARVRRSGRGFPVHISTRAAGPPEDRNAESPKSVREGRPPPQDVRSVSAQWGATRVTMYAVRLSGGVVAGAGDAVFAFAFCRENDTRPFALSGSRYLLRRNPLSVFLHPSVVAECGRHQYPTPLEKMVADLQRQVDPTTSTLEPMQRFALQQCFVAHACTTHPKELGPYKRMLRDLVTEWYRRRVCVDGDGGGVSDEDISCMLMGSYRVKRDQNPQWWYCAAMG